MAVSRLHRPPVTLLLAVACAAAIVLGQPSAAQPPRSAPPRNQSRPSAGAPAKPQPPKAVRPAAPPATEEAEQKPVGPLEQVEADAQACRTAAEAVQVYKIFLANPKLPAELRKPAQKRLAEWQAMEEQDMRRLGRKWITQEEYEEVAKKTENMIQHSFELLKLGNYDLAKKELVAASRLNPESGKADFVMGFVYSLVANNDAKAVVHYNEVLKREPNNAFALNNLAVSEVFLRRYAAASKHFRRALELMPDLQEVADNVGVALGMDGQVRNRQIPDDQAEELNDLYRKAIYELQLKPLSAARPAENDAGGGGPGGPGGRGGPKPGMGMQGPSGPAPPSVEGSGGPGGQGQQGSRPIFAYKLFGPLGRSRQGQQGLQGLLDEPAEVTVGISNGTGFVIAPGYVLTNRHVIEGATELTILDPNDREKHLSATVIAESEDPDLALLRCDDLASDSLALAETMPRRGSEIMVLGYPGGSLLGLELKSTRGQITSAADPKLEGGAFLFDANVNPGNSGGPVIDKEGKVVGVVVAIVRTSSVGTAYSVGIPMERVWPFLEEHLPDVEPEADSGAAEEWVDIDERCGPSTVFITAKIKRGGTKSEETEGTTDDFAQGGQGRPGAPGGPGFPGGPPGSAPPSGGYPFPGAPPGVAGSGPPGGSFGPPGSSPSGPPPGYPGYAGPPGSAPPGFPQGGPPGGSPPPGFPQGGPPGSVPGGPPSSGGYPTPGAPGSAAPPGTPGAPPGYPPGGIPGAGAPPGAPGAPGSPPGYPPPGTPGADRYPPGGGSGPPGGTGGPPGPPPGTPAPGNSPTPPAP